MPKKKTDETEVQVEATEAAVEMETVEETAVEAKAEEAAVEAKPEEASPVEAKPKKASSKKAKAEEISAIEIAAAESSDGDTIKKGKRAEKIGVVTSDKMTKTVVVRVDRLIKHPIYRKYVRKRKKFMAHDDKGAKIGDKVRIVETRPLSARKRWRVVEIIHKAEL